MSDAPTEVYMPHPAHFIGSRNCRFFLATYVNGFIVSTVGEYWPSLGARKIHADIHDPAWVTKNAGLMGDVYDAAYLERFGYEQIGCDRTYETMVFFAAKSELGCCPYVIASGRNITMSGYNDAGEAARGHRQMVRRFARRKEAPLRKRRTA